MVNRVDQNNDPYISTFPSPDNGFQGGEDALNGLPGGDNENTRWESDKSFVKRTRLSVPATYCIAPRLVERWEVFGGTTTIVLPIKASAVAAPIGSGSNVTASGNIEFLPLISWQRGKFYAMVQTGPSMGGIWAPDADMNTTSYGRTRAEIALKDITLGGWGIIGLGASDTIMNPRLMGFSGGDRTAGEASNTGITPGTIENQTYYMDFSLTDAEGRAGKVGGRFYYRRNPITGRGLLGLRAASKDLFMGVGTYTDFKWDFRGADGNYYPTAAIAGVRVPLDSREEWVLDAAVGIQNADHWSENFMPTFNERVAISFPLNILGCKGRGNLGAEATQEGGPKNPVVQKSGNSDPSGPTQDLTPEYSSFAWSNLRFDLDDPTEDIPAEFIIKSEKTIDFSQISDPAPYVVIRSDNGTNEEAHPGYTNADVVNDYAGIVFYNANTGSYYDPAVSPNYNQPLYLKSAVIYDEITGASSTVDLTTLPGYVDVNGGRVKFTGAGIRIPIPEALYTTTDANGNKVGRSSVRFRVVATVTHDLSSSPISEQGLGGNYGEAVITGGLHYQQ